MRKNYINFKLRIAGTGIFNNAHEGLTFIGDSLKDVKRALSNGIAFIGLCNIFTREDFMKIDRSLRTIASIGELLRV